MAMDRVPHLDLGPDLIEAIPEDLASFGAGERIIAIGIDEATQKERFGHILEAFSYGAPPHGGIAPGIDRLVMVLADTENIREVIAFPKVGGGYDPLMDAPSTIDAQQWAELGRGICRRWLDLATARRD